MERQKQEAAKQVDGSKGEGEGDKTPDSEKGQSSEKSQCADKGEIVNKGQGEILTKSQGEKEVCTEKGHGDNVQE